jgi:hypothetical protein
MPLRRDLSLKRTSCAGTTLNFFLDGRINNAKILFPGVACFLCAAILGSFTHVSNKDDHDRKLGVVRTGNFIDKSLARTAEEGGPTLTPPLGYERPSKDPQCEAPTDCAMAADNAPVQHDHVSRLQR